MLTLDNFLDTIKYMSLNDIKNMCKTNRLYMNYCKQAKNIIFKDIVYVLQYYTFKWKDPEDIQVEVIGAYKNIDDAINKMNELYNKKHGELDDRRIEDDHYVFTYNKSPKLYRDLAEENFINDQIWKWKIHIRKLQ